MAKVKCNNIVSATHGITAQPGILSFDADIDDGDHIPNFDEGEIYPIGADNVGSPGRFPVTGSLSLEDMSTAASLLSDAAADLVIVGKAAAGGSNQTYTFENCLFRRSRPTMQRQADGVNRVEFFCYSDDGSALPFAKT